MDTIESPDHLPQARSRTELPSGRFLKLLALLLAMVVLGPLAEKFLQVRWFEDILFTSILCWSVYSLEFERRLLVPAIALALPGIALMWLGARSDGVSFLRCLCIAAFLVYVVVAIMRYIFRQRLVNPDIIAGSIVVYLLMALAWSFAYQMIELLGPGSFSLNNHPAALTASEFLYFSLVTITTVGYGDIAPVSPIARAFANLEAVVGQLFLVILVSWLVGMYVSRRSSEPPQGR
jgi:voltage-gated potassium channel Kch